MGNELSLRRVVKLLIMYRPRGELVACRSEVVTDEGAFHKFISIAALHTATEHLACPLTLSLRQATSGTPAPFACVPDKA